MKCLTYMCERIKVIRFKQKLLLGVAERSKHGSEAKIATKCEHLYVSPTPT
jgi:hypothetical protein